MLDLQSLAVFGWLIFAVGVGLIAIALMPKSRLHSPAKRLADVLSGAFFCLMACTVMITSLTKSGRIDFVIGAVVSGLASWFIGRHVKRTDRALHS